MWSAWLSCRFIDFLGDSAGGELEEQSVHATHEPGALVTDVGVALGQETEHLAVTDGLDLSKVPGPQRGDGHRQRIVGIVLRAPTRAQQTGPSREGRRHVENMLTGGDELLGQQVAHAVGSLDGPHTCRERFSPRQQLVHLGPSRPDRARPRRR